MVGEDSVDDFLKSKNVRMTIRYKIVRGQYTPSARDGMIKSTLIEGLRSVGLLPATGEAS